jgi:AmmeMemoRadiSam system protein A
VLAAALMDPGADLGRQAPPAPAPSPAPAEGTRPPGASESEPTRTPSPECPDRSLEGAERDTLLRIAWRTLSGHLTNDPIKDSDLEAYALTPCLVAPRGLFVTLRKGDRVRGLQGEMEPTRPLYQQVIVFTRRSATRDPRFLPLTERDLGSLTIELSIIGPRRRVSGPGDIHPDADGVFLEKWGRRAVFLPGIAARQGWTAERTLEELCAQAALPKGSWSESARIEVFTTEVAAGGLPSGPAPPSSPSSSPAPSPSPGSTAAPAATAPPRGREAR